MLDDGSIGRIVFCEQCEEPVFITWDTSRQVPHTCPSAEALALRDAELELAVEALIHKSPKKSIKIVGYFNNFDVRP